MRPLLRITIGKVSSLGWDILSESLRLLPKVYPEFDIVICHNNLDEEEKARVSSFGVPTIEQKAEMAGFTFVDYHERQIRDFAWKLVPPRLRSEAHELWVDNDIVIRGRFEELDRWLSSNTGIISQGYSQDYGRFVRELPYRPSYCAGFFGLPPNFDLRQRVTSLTGPVPLRGFDEQGLVSLIVSQIDGFIMVPHHRLALLSERWKWRPSKLPPAMHFARSNRFINHTGWQTYRFMTTV